jgi:putative OPT family oligopeptide transporter
MQPFDSTPYVPASKNYPELTLKVIVLGILLAALLAASNAYLGLKMGRTVSGSIPAAVISIAVLHWFRKRNILEHNIVQTCASAGECLASGVIFTVPALLMLSIWSEFSYFETLLIALVGGFLGVLFSVPLRRAMLVEQKLPYPEGIAVAEILKASEEEAHKEKGAIYLVLGGVAASVFTVLQIGLKVIGDGFTLWTNKLGVITGFGFGFSPVLLGAGYIVGIGVVTTIALGNMVTWQLGVPILSWLTPEALLIDPTIAAADLYKGQLRYISIGALIFGGVWSLIMLLKPMMQAIKTSFHSLRHKGEKAILRTEHDIPMPIVLGLVVFLTVPLFFVFLNNLNASGLPITTGLLLMTVVVCTVFAIILGFVASSISSYLVGLVGTTSSPISGIAIAGISFIAVLLMGILGTEISFSNPEYATHAAGIAIVFAAIICLCAGLGGDNLQDLKAGLALGATPWKQQLVLLLGVIAGAIIIAPVLNLLLNAYGIGDVLPRAGMNPEKALVAPQATIMTAVASGVFLGKLNSLLLAIGAAIAAVVCFIDYRLRKTTRYSLPVLAFGLGMYLPMVMVMALFLGGVLSYLFQRNLTPAERPAAERRGILMAAGLIAGEALTGIVLAIPFSLSTQGENALSLNLPIPQGVLVILGLVAYLGIIALLWFTVKRKHAKIPHK